MSFAKLQSCAKTPMPLASLKTSPSLASISTRASSSNSLCELSALSRDDSTATLAELPQLQPAKPSLLKTLWPERRSILRLLALGAVAAWLWRRHIERASRSRRSWGSQRAASIVAAGLALLARLLQLRRGASDFEERPERVPSQQALVCVHPHGTYVMGMLAHLLHHGRGNPQGVLRDLYGVGADPVFQVPFYGELMLLMNVRCAKRATLDSILDSGKSAALCPGGIHEQLNTDPTREQLFFPPKLGFVRAAIRQGVPLVPLYNFGENQLFDVPQWSRRLSRWLKRTTGAGAAFGVGRHGLPLLPHPVPVETRIGRPVETGPADPEPSDAKVQRIFLEYCRELHRLFEENKASLPSEVACRGLRLVWRGHEAMDLSAAALADACGELAAGRGSQPRLTAVSLASRL